MEGGEGSPNHSDYEDDFTEAGLGWESYSEDEEETYKPSCTGMQDIYFCGNGMSFLLPTTAPIAHRLQTNPNHSMAWGWFTFLGRVRSWDGLFAFVRVSVSVPISPL